jgi:RND family efflux transporter MFP subunit
MPAGVRPPTLAEAVAEEVPILLEATGRVASTRQALLSAKVQGRIETLSVREGSIVGADQTLLTLDSRHIAAQLAAADAELENTRDRLRRMEKLFAEESVARQELENAQRAFKVAAANREGLVVQLSDTVIKAPFAGLVTEKRIEVGELASPGLPLLKVEDVTHLRLEATVAESDLRAIHAGGTVPVFVDALGQEALRGTIALVLPTGDPSTHTFLVKVNLPPTPGLKIGMFGRLRFQKGLVRAILIPRSAVIARGELTGVFTVGADNVTRLRFVKPGRSFGDRVEVLSGLTVGEKLLADGAKGVDGAPVPAR